MFVWTGRLYGGVLGFSGRIHNIVDGYCVPCHTILLLYDTLQPELHKILMETKEVWDRPGRTCACVDALGSHGRYKFPVCVYCSV